MSVVDGGSSGLVQRVQDILLRPKPTWEVIDTEAATIPGLYKGYICILAAIPPAAGFVASTLFGQGHLAIVGLIGAIVTYALSLGGVYLVALIADALATSFDGQKNQIQAFKGVAYAQTAAWVGGVFNLIPFLGGLLVLAASIYSLYLLYLGLPKLMKVPDDKAIGYTVVVIIVSIVVWGVIAMVVGSLAFIGLAGGAIAVGGFR